MHLLLALLLTTLFMPLMGDRAYAKSAVDFAQSAAKAYKAGQYLEAISAFKEANKRQPDPILDINIGRCYEKLGRFADALLHCKIALSASPPNSQARKAAMRCIERVEPQLARPKLKISSIPTGAILRIDGEIMGETPWTGEVTPGRRQLDMELNGYRPYSRSVIAKPAKSYSLDAELIPNSVGALLTITSLPAGAEITLNGQVAGVSPVRRMPVDVGAYNVEIKLAGHVTQVLSVALAEGTHLEKTITLVPNEGIQLREKPQWPGWVLVGTGVAMAGLGGYFGIRALSHRNEARDLATTSGSESDLRAYRTAVDTFRSSQITADLLYVGSIISTSSGLLLLYW
ncbi:MAG: PEGA domain-containing protein [Myxococcota bacterium]|nr:PEGA domain-containing protein [Myxococcota bacterium]